MSIAEKLTTIAENQQRVYQAGYEDGTAQGGGGEADLPYGYLKADPTWTNLANLCYARPNMIKHLKYSDTSNCTNFLAIFSTITTAQTSEDVVIPRLDYRKAQTIQNMCIYSNRIVEIGEMEIPKVTEASNAFVGCTELKRISFVAGCINVNISFSNSSKLDDASIQSIIDGLADLTGKSAKTLTLHATVGAKLTQAQKDAISAKNWTLVY